MTQAPRCIVHTEHIALPVVSCRVLQRCRSPLSELQQSALLALLLQANWLLVRPQDL